MEQVVGQSLHGKEILWQPKALEITNNFVMLEEQNLKESLTSENHSARKRYRTNKLCSENTSQEREN